MFRSVPSQKGKRHVILGKSNPMSPHKSNVKFSNVGLTNFSSVYLRNCALCPQAPSRPFLTTHPSSPRSGLEIMEVCAAFPTILPFTKQNAYPFYGSVNLFIIIFVLINHACRIFMRGYSHFLCVYLLLRSREWFGLLLCSR